MSRLPTALRVAAALLVFTMALPASAQWMWRDKDGRVTASDLPPPREVADKDILQRPEPVQRRAAPPAAAASAAVSANAPAAAAAPGASAPARSPLDAELQARRQAAEQAQAAKDKAEAERLATQRRENCNRARGQMAALDSGQRLARFNAKGEREILDDKARGDELQRARQVIASDCR